MRHVVRHLASRLGLASIAPSVMQVLAHIAVVISFRAASNSRFPAYLLRRNVRAKSNFSSKRTRYARRLTQTLAPSNPMSILPGHQAAHFQYAACGQTFGVMPRFASIMPLVAQVLGMLILSFHAGVKRHFPASVAVVILFHAVQALPSGVLAP